MTRKAYIEQIRRQIYNGMPSDDATVTVNLVNQHLDIAIAYAAKQNYTDNIKLDGISYVNNSFYTTFKSLTIEADENFLWKVTLPHLPFGIGENEGVSTAQVKDDKNNVSLPIVWITQAQKSFYQNMRSIPNKVLGYSESGFVYLVSAILLDSFTTTITMISGGTSTDLDSTLNVPADYLVACTEYLIKQLGFELAQKKDVSNDGLDAP